MQLRIRFLEAQDVIDGVVPPSCDKVNPYSPNNREAAADREEHVAIFHRQEMRAKQAVLAAKIWRMEYQWRPAYLVEGLEVSELLTPSTFSFDSALLNLSLTGETLRSLLRTPLRELPRVSRALSASFAGIQVPEKMRGLRPQTSNLWLTDRDGLSQALRSEAIREAGILDTFLFVDADDLVLPPEPANDQGSLETWARIENHLIEARIVGGGARHEMTGEAAEAMRTFINEINAIWPKLPSDIQPFAVRWPDLAIKLSLLLHLGNHDPRLPPSGQSENAGSDNPASKPPPVEIGAEIANLAIQLTKSLAARHASLVAQLSGHEPDGVDPMVARLVRKVRLKEPVTRRNLYRSFSQQGHALHEPVLAKAIALGMVVEDGCFLRTAQNGSDPQQQQSGSKCSASDFAHVEPAEA